MLTINPTGQSSFHAQRSQAPQGNPSKDWVSKGETAFSNGNLQEAKQCFEKALIWAPFDARIHNNLSVVYWKQGETEEALTSLTRALELDPEDQKVIMNCSQVFQALGRKQDARDILDAYLAKRPWDADARREMEKIDAAEEQVSASCRTGALDPAVFLNEQGERQFEKGKMDHARACFEMAIEHNPDYAKAHSNLGVIFWRQGDLQKALEYLYKALDIDSEDADILYNCAKALASAGELGSAADLMKLYLQKNPQEDAVWEEYSSLLCQMGGSAWKPDGLSSEVADIYIQMGEKLFQMKDYSGASEALERAFLLNPDRNDVCYLLGCLHLELGQKDEALEIMRAGLKPGDHHKKTVLTMGDILISLERFADARMLFDDYLADNDGDQDILEALARLSTNV